MENCNNCSHSDEIGPFKVVVCGMHYEMVIDCLENNFCHWIPKREDKSIVLPSQNLHVL